MVGRRCAQMMPIGRPCRATPMRDARFCYWHNPATQEDAAEARKLGGIRRRRERAVAAAYDFEGLRSADQIMRIVEIVTIDGLALENSVARGRLLLGAAATAAKLLEVGDHETRLAILEAAVEDTAHARREPSRGGLLEEAS
jgi:hypothetical protein